MNHKTIIFLIISAISAIQFQQARATATTHIWGPSTDVQGFGLWHITTDLYISMMQDASGYQLPPISNLGLTVGILPFKKINAEIGIDHKAGMGSLDSNPLYANFKIGVPENAFGSISPAIAIGAYELGTKNDLTNFNIIYGKFAKSFKMGKLNLGRISLGYFAGNHRLLLDGHGQKDNKGAMAAWERTFPEFAERFWLCIEYMGTKSAYGSLNLGASWKFASNVAFLAGYELYNNPKLIDTATLQVDIDF
jgi:hypothetical protein